LTDGINLIRDKIMMKFTRVIRNIGFASTIIATPILSVNAATLFGDPNIHPYAGFFAGLTGVGSSSTSNVQITKDGTDTFANSGSKQSVNYGVVGGINIVRPTAQNWFNSYQFEASIWQLNSTNLGGVHTIPIEQQQYNYKYKFQLQAFSLDASANLYQWQQILPFVGVGVDFASANTKNYEETPIGSATPVLLNLASKTQNLFLYHGRIGVRYKLPKQWQLQLAYTYYPSFKVKTGDGNTGIVSTAGFSNSVSLSNIGLQISYQF